MSTLVRSTFKDAMDRMRRRYPDRKCVEPNAPHLVPYYDSNARVEVDVYGDGEVIERGRVSLTLGWRPSFLLMHRRSDHGSSTLLDRRSRVLRVIAK